MVTRSAMLIGSEKGKQEAEVEVQRFSLGWTGSGTSPITGLLDVWEPD